MVVGLTPLARLKLYSRPSPKGWSGSYAPKDVYIVTDRVENNLEVFAVLLPESIHPFQNFLLG
jgi:hypothetical protein